MRVVIQRTTRAEVRTEGRTIAHIGCGLMLLVGVTHGDTDTDARYLAKKVAGMRIFSDNEGKMNLSVKDCGGSIISVSQFTLYADTRHGNRPSFVAAAGHTEAKALYELFNSLLAEEYGLHVETGLFGADMEVDFINDGPVTILLDSRT